MECEAADSSRVENKEKDDRINILDPNSQHKIQIVLGRAKQYTPEDVAEKLITYEQEFCTQAFLTELKPLLPTTDQVVKLNAYKDSSIDVLATLHPADRLMVNLLKVHRLKQRIDGMIYKERFDDMFEGVEQVRRCCALPCPDLT